MGDGFGERMGKALRDAAGPDAPRADVRRLHVSRCTLDGAEPGLERAVERFVAAFRW